MSHSAPWSIFHHHLHRTLRQRQLLRSGQRLLVAVSGGQDSLCLAQLLVDLQSKWGWQLAIAHCDHRWHTSSANAVQHVQYQAQAWDLPFFVRAAPDAVAQNQREAIARTWRYQVLAELAETQGYSSVLTGHTATDRAETLLHNLLRGSGLDGLQALSWRRSLTDNVELVRPLLTMTRAETGKFCRQASLEIWHDTSNQDLHYTRNRIRHELFPLLRDRFNPNAESTLAQTAEILRADVEYLETETEKIWKVAAQFTAEPWVPDLSAAERQKYEFEQQRPNSKYSNPFLRLDRNVLRDVPLAIQRRVIRRCLLHFLPESPRYDHIEKLVGLIDAPNKSQSDPFPGGAIARVEGQWLVLFPSS